jgi:hypothetical protein
MKQVETLFLEIKVYDDGAIRARRKDGRRLNEEDKAEARRVANSLPGVTLDDVLRLFPAARLVGKS